MKKTIILSFLMLYIYTACTSAPVPSQTEVSTAAPTSIKPTPQVTFQMSRKTPMTKPTLPPNLKLPGEETDERSFQHGIDFIPLQDGSYYLFWSSSGNPPAGAQTNGDWSHNIYYSKIDTTSPQIDPVEFIAKPEAQEPVSAAIASDGHILLTMEDGWNARNTIAQRYGVYDSNLEPIKPYPNDVLDGGHSGHTASAGGTFVVFYSDDWVEGGGVDDLGTGDDVLAQVYDTNGEPLYKVDVAVGEDTRDWWPLVAGSDNNALLLWQRYIDGEEYADLMIAMLDPASGKLVTQPQSLGVHVKYYTYSCTFISGINRFLVLGTDEEANGFGILLDKTGKIISRNNELPPLVRESQPAVLESGDLAMIAFPMAPYGMALLSADEDAVTYRQVQQDRYAWGYAGTDGIFLNETTIYFVNLSPSGLVEKTFRID
jgi:hypothetical protein